MSRERVLDLIFLIFVMMASMTIQFAGGAALDPLRDALTDEPIHHDSAEDNMDEMFSAATFWVPLVAQIGSIVIVVWREFRRQRVTGRRGVI